MKKFTMKPIIFMVVITIVYTTVLAGINAVTEERIVLNEQLSEQLSFLYVLNMTPETIEAPVVNRLYQERVEEIQVNGDRVYEAYDEDGNLYAYIVPMAGSALWGELRGIIALSTDFETVLGIDFLSHSETPGLGGRIDEPEFKEQFRGIEIDPEADRNYLIFNPNPGGQVDAISGATGTSNAVRNIFNSTMQEFMSETREALNND